MKKTFLLLFIFCSFFDYVGAVSFLGQKKVAACMISAYLLSYVGLVVWSTSDAETRKDLGHWVKETNKSLFTGIDGEERSLTSNLLCLGNYAALSVIGYSVYQSFFVKKVQPKSFKWFFF